MLRYAAHKNGAALQYVSSIDESLLAKNRHVLNFFIFKSTDSRQPVFDNLLPLSILPGTSFERISFLSVTGEDSFQKIDPSAQLSQSGAAGKDPSWERLKAEFSQYYPSKGSPLVPISLPKDKELQQKYADPMVDAIWAEHR